MSRRVSSMSRHRTQQNTDSTIVPDMLRKNALAWLAESILSGCQVFLCTTHRISKESQAELENFYNSSRWSEKCSEAWQYFYLSKIICKIFLFFLNQGHSGKNNGTYCAIYFHVDYTAIFDSDVRKKKLMHILIWFTVGYEYVKQERTKNSLPSLFRCCLK